MFRCLKLKNRKLLICTDVLFYNFNLVLPRRNKVFRVYETIRACGTFHIAQALHPLAEKVALKGEEGPQEADCNNMHRKRILG